MKDFLGNEIKVGDTVVYCRLHYRELSKGVVEKLTPKMVIIKCGSGTVKQSPLQVVSLTGLMSELYG